MAGVQEELHRLEKLLHYVSVPAKDCGQALQNFGDGYCYISTSRLLKVVKKVLSQAKHQRTPAWSLSEKALQEAMVQLRPLPFFPNGDGPAGLYLKEAHAHLRLSELLLRQCHLFEGQQPQRQELINTGQPKQTTQDGTHHSTSSSCTRLTGAELQLSSYVSGQQAPSLGVGEDSGRALVVHQADQLSMPLSQRPLQDSHILGIRYVLDRQGRHEQAAQVYQQLLAAPSIYETDELRTAEMRCCYCNRSLTVVCFQSHLNKGSVKVHCLAHRQQGDEMFAISRELHLLKDYVEDPRPLAAPDLTRTRPCTRRSDLNCGDQPGHVLTWAHTKELLLGWGYSHLVHGASLIGFEAPEDKQGRPLEINPQTVTTATLVDFILTELKRKKYFNTNMVIDTHSLGSTSSRLTDAVRRWRRHETTIKQGMMGTSKTSTTLFLLGGAGTFTDWHIDWSEATNYCMLLTGMEPDTTAKDVELPAAVWWFLGPDTRSITAAQEWLAQRREQKHKKPCPKRSFDKAAKEPMSDEDLEAMQQHVTAEGGCMVRVDQRPGDMVSVPPGWMHIVINKKACAKIAWDLFDDQHWANYLMTSHDLLAQVTKMKNAMDYMDVEEALITQIKLSTQAWSEADEAGRRQLWLQHLKRQQEQRPQQAMQVQQMVLDNGSASGNRGAGRQEALQPSQLQLALVPQHQQWQQGMQVALAPQYDMLLQHGSHPGWFQDNMLAPIEPLGAHMTGSDHPGGQLLLEYDASQQTAAAQSGRQRRRSVKLTDMLGPVRKTALLLPEVSGSQAGLRYSGSGSARPPQHSESGVAGDARGGRGDVPGGEVGAGRPSKRRTRSHGLEEQEQEEEEHVRARQRLHQGSRRGRTESQLEEGQQGGDEDSESPGGLSHMVEAGEEVQQRPKQTLVMSRVEAMDLLPATCSPVPGPFVCKAKRAGSVQCFPDLMEGPASK